jgi:DNA segregation ATPase FtsK/SpoIIIE-like protein
MFRKAKKNYMELSIRVFADEHERSINVTSKDKSLPQNGDDFHLVLNDWDHGAGNILRNALWATRTISGDEREYLPCELSYEDIAESPWDEFPLGKNEDLSVAMWSPATSPNLLLFGPPGSGKSVIDRNLIFHCLQHPDEWRIYGIDPWRTALSPYKKYSPVVEKIVGDDLEESLEVCRVVRDEMLNRHDKMDALDVYDYRDLPDALPAIILLVTEASWLLSRSESRTHSGLEEDAFRDEMSMILTKISRLGRASGVHLVLSSQRPDVIDGELKENMTTKVVLGRTSAAQSLLVLGHDKASRYTATISKKGCDGRYHLVDVMGRGYIQENEVGQPFQAAFAPIDWYDERLKKNQPADD